MRFLKVLLPIVVLSCNPFICYADLKDSNNEMSSQNDNRNNDLESAKSFIEDTGNKVIRILVNKSSSLSERQEQFRQVIQEKFDMRSIGQFVLGRYWRQATPDQKLEYLKLFEDSIVESYSHQFDNYTNEQLKVTNARPSNKGGVIITSKIIRASGAPLQVDWKVFQTKDSLRILDVIVNGVSMSITYRTEYANAYNANGASMEGLLKALRAKKITNSIPETSDAST